MPKELEPRHWIPRRGHSLALLLAMTGAAVLATLACAGSVPPPEAGPPESAPAPESPVGMSEAPGLDLPEAELGTQRLFRIRYQGDQGEGRLRLVLRLVREDRYSITTSDVLGRALWGLSLGQGELVLVDHRAETFCRTRGEVTLPEVALAPLPLHSIPGVLLGFLPVPEAGELRREGVDSVEIVDGPERRWSARMVGETVEAWTLWLNDVPTLWWTRQPNGGILSHRQGVQFRWRQVVAESLDREPPPLETPDGYRERSCDESALQEPSQDQPAPRSPGSA